MTARLFLSTLMVLLSACTATDYKPTTGPAIPSPTLEPSAPPTDTVSAPSSYRELLLRSEDAVAGRDYQGALALLERAQRIAPDRAEIYLRMAKVHRIRGERDLARSTAERGLLYCETREECNALRRFLRKRSR